MLEVIIFTFIASAFCLGIAFEKGEQRHREHVAFTLAESERFKRAKEMPLFAKLSGIPQRDAAE